MKKLPLAFWEPNVRQNAFKTTTKKGPLLVKFRRKLPLMSSSSQDPRREWRNYIVFLSCIVGFGKWLEASKSLISSLTVSCQLTVQRHKLWGTRGLCLDFSAWSLRCYQEERWAQPPGSAGHNHRLGTLEGRGRVVVIMTIIGHFLCARLNVLCAWLHNIPMRWILLLSPLYRSGNWGSLSLSLFFFFFFFVSSTTCKSFWTRNRTCATAATQATAVTTSDP